MLSFYLFKVCGDTAVDFETGAIYLPKLDNSAYKDKLSNEYKVKGNPKYPFCGIIPFAISFYLDGI